MNANRVPSSKTPEKGLPAGKSIVFINADRKSVV